MTTTQKLKEAIRKVRETSTEAESEHNINCFINLYYALGEEELHDGIATAMQDNCMEETYEDIMFYFGELS